MIFHPHRFSPTHYAEDPYDLLLPLSDPNTKAKPHHLRTCTGCGKKVERNCPQTKKVRFLCLDCKKELRIKRELNYFRNGKPLRTHE